MRKPQLYLLAGLLMVAAVSAAVAQAPRPDASTPTGALRGGPPFTQDWPRHERVLSRDERLELQQLLNRHGFDTGEPDGHLGAQTRAAIRHFQARIGQVPDGFASASILDRLRGH